jgi:hypothetical protein
MAKDSDNLLDDAEAAALLEAEYAARGAPVDEVARARVWARLSKALAARRRAKKRLGMGAVAALAAGLALTVVQRSGIWAGDQRIKGGERGVPVQLNAYATTPDGLRPLDEQPTPGTIVVFKVHAPQAGQFVLLTSEDGKVKVWTEPAPLAAVETLVSAKDEGLAFRVDAGRHVRVCAVAAADQAGLAALTAAPEAALKLALPEACAAW